MSLTNFNNTISWGDFTQMPSRPAGENEDASIFTRLNFKYDMKAVGRAVMVENFETDVVIVTNSSWVVTSERSDELLKHEQGHFDISALTAREFYDKAQLIKGESSQDLTTKINRLNATLQAKRNGVNKRYDKQTDHHNKTDVQKSWDKKIDTAKKNMNGTVDDLA
jgi:Bacterial protein of unknown function (DUF922)